MTCRQLVPRPTYMNRIEPYIGTRQVKVLQGIRRCGKSSILDMLHDRLLQRGVDPRNIFRKRFDEFGLPLHPTAQNLTEELSAAFASADPDATFTIFLDEIQEVPDWETVVRGLTTKDNVDVYITGSNAHFLSSDLATLLAGRTISLTVRPLSFSEYLDFSAHYDGEPSGTRSGSARRTPNRLGIGESGSDKLDDDPFAPSEHRARPRTTDELFNDYLRFGGMPSLFSLRGRDPEVMARELESIYNTVILKDVAERLGIRDIALLNRLVAYLFSTSGNLFSTRKVAGALTSSGRRTTSETVDSYINALEQAFILNESVQTGLQGKQLLNPMRKFYPADNGLRNMAIGFSNRDLGFQLENVVANELLRRGYAITVGATPNAEVDFTCTRFDEREYIQVTQTMLDPATRERELAPLRSIRDSFPKTVLTLDRFGTGITEDGIRVANIIDWLLDA